MVYINGSSSTMWRFIPSYSLQSGTTHSLQGIPLFKKKIMKLLEHFQDKIGMLKKEIYSSSEGQLEQVFWMTYLSLQRNYSI